MEKKFQDLLKKTKAHDDRDSEAAKTFEFDIFSEGNWFLTMNDLDKNLTRQSSEVPVVKNLEEKSGLVEVALQTSNDLSINPNHKLKVLFIGDTYNRDSDNNDEDLLQKMIFAMKLQPNEYKRLKLDSDLETISNPEENMTNPHEAYLKLISDIETNYPAFVISLGALATNLLLGKREKMSGIHGKYFKLQANGFDYLMMPLFHPDFLLINPNMKRTAWIDLQKIMVSLGKN